MEAVPMGNGAPRIGHACGLASTAHAKDKKDYSG
jgi:hypothetical protein